MHSDDTAVALLPGFRIGNHCALVQLIEVRKIGQRCCDVGVEHVTGLRVRDLSLRFAVVVLKWLVVDHLGQFVLARHVVYLVGAHFLRLVEIESLFIFELFGF